MANALYYQYTFKTPRKDTLLKNDVIKDLSFGLATVFEDYSQRKELGFTTSLFDHGDEGYPVIDITLNMVKATVENLEFLIEVLTVPSKLIPTHRTHLENTITRMLAYEDFKLWWSSDPRGPRKRLLSDKEKILKELKEMPKYDGSNDLQLEDIELSISDALEFFGFDKNIKVKELKKIFKKKFREFQLKYHPDSDTGNEKTFLHVQNCRDVLEKWMKRS